MKIISLLKQKKLLEQTSDHFDPENTLQSVWNDVDELQRDVLRKEQANIERYNKKVSTRLSLLTNHFIILQMILDGDSGPTEAIEADDDKSSENVRQKKKRELREQRQLVMQFDKLSKKFDKGAAQAGETAKIVQKGTGKLVAETAGMLKKKTKKKKEKSLSAKLRLKSKKNN